MKKNALLLSLVLLLGLLSCQNKSKKAEASELLSLVPSKTAAILKTKDFSRFTNDLKRNSFINNNQDLPIHRFFTEAYQPLAKLNLSDRGILLFSKEGKNEISTTLLIPENPTPKDSLNYEETDSYDYNGERIKQYNIEGQTLYGVKLEKNYVFGNSKLNIENIVRLSKEKIEPNDNLRKVFEASSDKKPSLLVNIDEFQKIYSVITPKKPSVFFRNTTSWAEIDLNIHPQSITFNGVTIPEKNEVLGILDGTKAAENEIQKITPISASGLFSFTYNDFSIIEDNISFYRKEDYPDIDTELLSSATEIGQIYAGDSSALAIKPIDIEGTIKKLQDENEKLKTFRESEIFTFSDSDYFSIALSPLINAGHYKFFTQLKDFIVFTENESDMEDLIANVNNKTVITEREGYKRLYKDLDDKSSLLLLGITGNVLKNLAESVDSKHKDAYLKADTEEYEFAALQFIRHDNFMYINGSFTESNAKKQAKSGVQTKTLNPGEEIIAGPWFFENWRTKRNDIVMQGKSNTLYFYDESGKLSWKKQLSGKILGDIQPIDLYRNGRIQMAFVTPQTFYIIDREGNVVKPFNKSMKSTITQPLSVFDYDKNGKYRFLVTQGNILTMFDKNMNPVEGFEFTKANSKITQAPKHYRIGSKDYILIPEQSGKLNILNPRGQTRVNVQENIDFSKNEWYLYHNKFTSTNNKGELIQIDQQGRVTKKDLKQEKEHHIYATEKTLAAFSGNTLKINDKSTSLDEGQYTAPKIFYLNDKLYIAVTDLQASNIYLFDSQSNLFSGFPIYGNSAVDLEAFDNQIKLIVKGEDNTVLIYEVK